MKNANFNFNTWEQMGNEIKDIRRRFIKFLTNPDYQKLLTAYELDCLPRSLNHIERFRSRAEDRMLKFSGPCPGETQKWLNVFYGEENK